MLCLLWSVLPFYAAQVDTLMVKSPSMNKEVQVVVVVPDIALGKRMLIAGDIPVAWFWPDSQDVDRHSPELPQIADEKGIIFVCPDGKKQLVLG